MQQGTSGSINVNGKTNTTVGRAAFSKFYPYDPTLRNLKTFSKYLWLKSKIEFVPKKTKIIWRYGVVAFPQNLALIPSTVSPKMRFTDHRRTTDARVTKITLRTQSSRTKMLR